MSRARIHTDGACLGNPGPSGVGAVLQLEGRTHEISHHIGTTTNNVAEYSALIEALRLARDLVDAIGPRERTPHHLELGHGLENGVLVHDGGERFASGQLGVADSLGLINLRENNPVLHLEAVRRHPELLHCEGH